MSARRSTDRSGDERLASGFDLRISAMAQRAVCAGAVTLALVLGPAFVSGVKGLLGGEEDLRAVHGRELAGSEGEAVAAHGTLCGEDALQQGANAWFTLLLEGEGAMPAGFSDELPEAFREEVVDPGDRDMVVAFEDGSVVSVVRRGEEAEVFRQIADELVGKGWTYVESGQELAGSFLKEGGRYTWLMVFCSGADGTVGVTICAN